MPPWQPGRAQKISDAAKKRYAEGGVHPSAGSTWSDERRAKVNAAWEAKRLAKAEQDSPIVESKLLRQKDRTHCPKGHAYEGDNLRVYIRSNGTQRRECAECIRFNDRLRYAINRDAELEAIKEEARLMGSTGSDPRPDVQERPHESPEAGKNKSYPAPGGLGTGKVPEKNPQREHPDSDK